MSSWRALCLARASYNQNDMTLNQKKNAQEQLKSYNIADSYINIDSIGALLLFISLA